MAPLTLEQRLTQHELKDEERHGQTLATMARIEGKIDVLTMAVAETRKVAESASTEVDDLAEKTGSHRVLSAEKKSDFWVKLIAGIVSALVVSTLIAGAGYIVGSKLGHSGAMSHEQHP